MVSCTQCGGDLNPTLCISENVPVERVRNAYAMVDSADALLVAGSSLTVYSGRRFAMHAHKEENPSPSSIPETKADDLASSHRR